MPLPLGKIFSWGFVVLVVAVLAALWLDRNVVMKHVGS